MISSPRGLSLLSLVLVAWNCGSGCRTYKNQAAEMKSAWASGHPDIAARDFEKRAKSEDGSRDEVVWDLEAGAAWRAAGGFTNSNMRFEAARTRIEAYEKKAKVRVGQEAAALMSNQQNLAYEGRDYDKIMLHTYRALNYLTLGDPDKARPEIIRAYQRQQDAVEENAKRIEKARDDASKDPNKAKIEKAQQDPKFNSQIDQITKPLEGFRFYADYVNPFSVFLDGLYFKYAGVDSSDRERARKSLARVAEIVPENQFIQADLKDVEGTGAPASGVTYVIFETGRGASLDQLRIDIPIIVTSVSYVGAAFPRLEFHDDFCRTLMVRANDQEERTALVGSMDAVIALEFRNAWPRILAKTIASTVAKGVAAYALNEGAGKQDAIAGLIVRIATAAAQAAVNIADTRSWTSLPKEFQVARVNTPPGRVVNLSVPSGPATDVHLIDGSVNVVYVRSVSLATPLVISQFKLK